jgi:hypothetical protein
MGFLDSLKAKKEEIEEKKDGEGPSSGSGKYSEPCALCGGQGTDKKWMGQYWHRKCARSARKGARRMV